MCSGKLNWLSASKISDNLLRWTDDEIVSLATVQPLEYIQESTKQRNQSEVHIYLEMKLKINKKAKEIKKIESKALQMVLKFKKLF